MRQIHKCPKLGNFPSTSFCFGKYFTSNNASMQLFYRCTKLYNCSSITQTMEISKRLFSIFFNVSKEYIYNKCLSKKRCTMCNMEPLHAFYQPNQSSFSKT